MRVSEGNRRYQSGGCTVCRLHRRRGSLRRGHDPRGSGARIVWHHKANSESRTFNVSYRVTGGKPRGRVRRRDRRLLAGLGRPMGLRPRPADRDVQGSGPATPRGRGDAPEPLRCLGHRATSRAPTSSNPAWLASRPWTCPTTPSSRCGCWSPAPRPGRERRRQRRRRLPRSSPRSRASPTTTTRCSTGPSAGSRTTRCYWP